MNVNIRKYIKDNFKSSNEDEIKNSILESIKDKDELTLPGLGVFFEIVWENIDDNEKNKIINILKNNMN